VFDEVRQQVDEEMRALLDNLKALLAAEAAAKSGGRCGMIAVCMCVWVGGGVEQVTLEWWGGSKCGML
jgi:hypothetical protein